MGQRHRVQTYWDRDPPAHRALAHCRSLRGNHEKTPLLTAAGTGNAFGCRLLLELRADPTAKTDMGNNFWDMASYSSREIRDLANSCQIGPNREVMGQWMRRRIVFLRMLRGPWR